MRGASYQPYYRVKPESDLRKAWQFGLSELKLATTEEGVYYLCKYLHKAPMHRCVASVRYGKEEKVAALEALPVSVDDASERREGNRENRSIPQKGLTVQGGGPGGGNRIPGEERNSSNG